MKKACVFLSGRGSNFKSLLESAKDFEIVLVISDKPEALGLQYAEERGIETYSIARSDCSSLKAQKQLLYEAFENSEADFILLAGYMQILEESFVQKHAGKILNIHPALLPKYAGLHTHQRALDAGDSEHGCSVHFVDAGVDTGPVIAQAKVLVEADDDADSLAARVLEREHIIYPLVANAFARGEVSCEETGVRVSAELRKALETADFIIPS